MTETTTFEFRGERITVINKPPYNDTLFIDADEDAEVSFEPDAPDSHAAATEQPRAH